MDGNYLLSLVYIHQKNKCEKPLYSFTCKNNSITKTSRHYWSTIHSPESAQQLL